MAREVRLSSAEAWEERALAWADLVRSGSDKTFAWNGSAFLESLPEPGSLTVDIACGEGRMARTLTELGHKVVGIDGSPTLVRLAGEAEPDGDYRVGDVAALPVPNGCTDLAIAFMCLQDVDDAAAAIFEAGRILEPDGRFCLAVVHPLASAGELSADDALVVTESYFKERPVTRSLGAGSIVPFHRPLEAYFGAVEEADLLVETVREIPMRRRAPDALPMFLHIRAVKLTS